MLLLIFLLFNSDRYMILILMSNFSYCLSVEIISFSYFICRLSFDMAIRSMSLFLLKSLLFSPLPYQYIDISPLVLYLLNNLLASVDIIFFLVLRFIVV